MSKQRVIPIGKQLLVKPIEKKETYKNTNIILAPEQVQQIPRGTVVAVGAKVNEEIKPGDFIQWVLEHRDDREFEHDGEPHLLMSDHAIVCKLENV